MVRVGCHVLGKKERGSIQFYGPMAFQKTLVNKSSLSGALTAGRRVLGLRVPNGRGDMSKEHPIARSMDSVRARPHALRDQEQAPIAVLPRESHVTLMLKCSAPSMFCFHWHVV